MKARFVDETRQAIEDLGLLLGHFASHSFQIGAVTVASQAELEDSQIITLGQWNSAAYHKALIFRGQYI